ncbi:MAG: UDP-N-acetylmuramoyl-L-alanyl-D-glutamate--2,6-diaminopimelate ligase, partial [Deltaproteobacteria bacterium]|nr:UDP-N-acetylmuramoyl-L-alanyl-D-glutamate--2,6-diaminopimelate ligase [Deltaproteobacteria bacterium]
MISLSSYIDHLRCGIVKLSGVDARLIAGATNDSRKVQPGWLFVAVSGSSDDGHRYIDQAMAAGATVVVSERELDLPDTVVMIQVADAYAAAAGAAEVMYGFPARNLELIGITGTNGKTTTAFLLREIFQQHGEKVGLVGTVGYDCGDTWEPAARTTPDPFVLQSLFARMLENGCKRVLLEVSSHALIQNRLGESRFSGAIFTNLSGDHLDYHENMENYYLAKRLLFKKLLKNDALAVINGADSYGQRLIRELAGSRILTWGSEYLPVDFRLRLVKEELSGQVVQLTGSDGACRWRAPL